MTTMRQNEVDRLQRKLNDAKHNDENSMADAKKVIDEFKLFVDLVMDPRMVAYGYELAFLESISAAVSRAYQDLKIVAGQERLAVWEWEEKRDELRAKADEALKERMDTARKEFNRKGKEADEKINSRIHG